MGSIQVNIHFTVPLSMEKKERNNNKKKLHPSSLIFPNPLPARYLNPPSHGLQKRETPSQPIANPSLRGFTVPLSVKKKLYYHPFVIYTCCLKSWWVILKLKFHPLQVVRSKRDLDIQILHLLIVWPSRLNRENRTLNNNFRATSVGRFLEMFLTTWRDDHLARK